MLNSLFARHTSGKFLLRIDDTDAGRSKPEFEAAIVADLAWLGVLHDVFARQSEREDAYRAAAEKLKSNGRLYPAYETPEELDRKRKRAQARGLPPVYDRAALRLTAEERTKLQARSPHWRFKLSQSKVKWNDLIRGPVEIDTATLSDPVLVREDGRFLYTLPSVVDDIDFAISHIIRGEDHVTNTAVQIEIFEALGAGPPAFAHHPLIVGAGGESLSKRLGSLSLQQLREEGIEPLTLVAYLAKIGTSDPIEPRPSLDVLATEFDFAKVGRAPAHFDPAELMALNGKLLHTLSYDTVRERLKTEGADLGEAFWEAVKSNLTKVSDAGAMRALVEGPVTPLREDPELLSKAASLLPPEPYTDSSWNEWTSAVGAATGRKGRALYHPLRLALTGRETGPELKKLLPLIGRKRALARLEGKVA